MAATGLNRPAADELLARADWHVKTAIVMQRLGLDAAAARARLDACGGHVRKALGSSA
jgi:N-acetylmuramic acid 6-phosphate etherase